MPHTRPPNILIIHCDQLRFDALGCTGHPGNPTPNIDALAAEGISFSRHMSANPICMPSRASFFTGLYPTAHGVCSNGVPLNRKEYSPYGSSPYDTGKGLIEPATIADRMAEAGYRTAAFGKLHLTPSCSPEGQAYPESESNWQSLQDANWHGPYFGFEHVELTHAHGEMPGGHYDQWLRKNHPDLVEAIAENGRPEHRPIPELGDCYPSVLTPETHPSAWLADRTSEWIGDDSEKPFFAFMGIPDPHHPFIPLQEDIDYFDGVDMLPPIDPTGEQADWLSKDGGQDIRHFTAEQHTIVRRYTAAMVRTIDRAVGKVVDTLKAKGLWENTVILFTSDHGDHLGDHGRLRKSHIAARTLLNVPCIMRLPDGRIKTPRRDSATSNTDILSTCLELAGVPADAQTQGRSLLSSETFPAFTYAFDGSFEGSNFTIHDERFRYTLYAGTGQEQLFDQLDDPGESHNLAKDEQFAEVKQRLRDELTWSALRHQRPIAGRVACW